MLFALLPAARFLPALVVVAWGVDATWALVLSQVVLSFVLPIPMIALVAFTRQREVMGAFANGWLTSVAAVAGVAIVLALNLVLVLQTLGVGVPLLG